MAARAKKRWRTGVLLLCSFTLIVGAAWLVLGGRTRPPSPRPAMISVANGSEQIDVLIDDVVVARLSPRTSGMNMTDVLFHKSGSTHFAFAISLNGVITHKPEATYNVRPGDMLSVGFGYGATAPQAWDATTSFSAPSLIPGDPSRVWCWFDSASRSMDTFVVRTWGPEDERAVRWRLWRSGYSVRERNANGNDIRLQVAPPSGWSVLEACMEVKGWKGVSDTQFQQVVH